VSAPVVAFDLTQADLSEFVPLTTHYFPLDSRLGRGVIEGADGSAGWLWMYRTDLAEWCGVVGDRCVISAAPRAPGVYSDDQCGAEDVALRSSQCVAASPPEVGIDFAEQRFYELLKLSVDDTFHISSGECVPGVGQSSPVSGVYRLGAEVPPSKFPRLVRTPIGTEGRLRPIFLATEAGALLESSSFDGWRDTERDEDCSATETIEGVTRCLSHAHVSYGDAELYTSADCTGTRVLNDESLSPPEAASGDTMVQMEDGVAIAAWSITGPYEGEVFVKASPDNCFARAFNDPLYTVSPLPLSTFAELTRRGP
jgi:hypothetical protein